EARKTVSQPMSTLFAGMKPEQQGEIFWRISWPLAALILAFLAIPLSATSPRAGRSLNMISAVLIFILYLNGISIVQTWIEHGKFNYIVGLIGLNGSVFLFGLLLFIRRVYMMRWIPAWASPWTWYHRLTASRTSSAEQEER
ncbi:permease, YjgP/YjgQ family, partial [gut metagenome]